MTSTLTSGDNIGIMDQAFFVGKNEILGWINSFFGVSLHMLCNMCVCLQLNLTKIEQCATGAVYCQVLDAIYPGTVQMAKVNWQAKADYEFSYNYKILQNALQKNGIGRYIDTAKLMRAKYQDNLEMCQWIKRYFDINYNGNPYDAVGRRKGAQLFLIAGCGETNKGMPQVAPAQPPTLA